MPAGGPTVGYRAGPPEPPLLHASQSAVARRVHSTRKAIQNTLLVAVFTVGCADDNAVKSAGEHGGGGFDTGWYEAPHDEAWHAEDTASAAADNAAPAGPYDGLRPLLPELHEDGVDADAEYSAGERVQVQVMLSNEGDHDFDRSPGLVLTVDHTEVHIADAEQWVPALASGEVAHFEWWAVLGPEVGSGEPITFTAEVTARGCTDDCPVPHQVHISTHSH